jgi:hypothetical protein
MEERDRERMKLIQNVSTLQVFFSEDHDSEEWV